MELSNREKAVGPLIIVCDFDGTVAADDVQHVIFNRFAGDRWIPVNEAWRRGEVTTEERARAQWAMVPPFSKQAVLDLVAAIPLDTGFEGLVRSVLGRDWQIVIASDGFDLYIERILAANGLSHVPFSANHLELHDTGFSMSFTRPNPVCCRLGNCKRLIVDEQRRPGGRVVFVGDGLSDACGAAAADLVLAKGLLADYCRRQGIPFAPFTDFHEVRHRLLEFVYTTP